MACLVVQVGKNYYIHIKSMKRTVQGEGKSERGSHNDLMNELIKIFHA
jgi:hypothetical protein